MDSRIGYKDIFRQKEYMKMIVAALINRFGDSIDAIASTWIVYEITGNAAWSAIIYALNKIPTVIVTPFAGAWVEGRNKKAIMIVSDIIRAICVATVATGYLLEFLSPWIIALTTLVISTVEAFRGPANTALTPKILEKQYYEYGISLMNTLSTIIELIGTALAAGIIALIGTAAAIYIDMVTFLLSALIIATMNTKELYLKKQRFEVGEYFQALQEGFRYVKSEKAVLFFCGVAVFLNAILVPFNSLQAPLANEILQGGAEILSILGIALMSGTLAGSALYPVLKNKLRAKSVVILAGVGIGFYYLGLVFCMPLYINKTFMYLYTAISSAIFGFMATLFNAFVNVEFVKKIDENYLARTISVTIALCSLASPLFSFFTSCIVTFMKTEWIFMIAGLVDLLLLPLFLRSKVLDEQIDVAVRNSAIIN